MVDVLHLSCYQPLNDRNLINRKFPCNSGWLINLHLGWLNDKTIFPFNPVGGSPAWAKRSPNHWTTRIVLASSASPREKSNLTLIISSSWPSSILVEFIRKVCVKVSWSLYSNRLTLPLTQVHYCSWFPCYNHQYWFPSNVCPKLHHESATLYEVNTLPSLVNSWKDKASPVSLVWQVHIAPQFLCILTHPVLEPLMFTARTSPAPPTL